MYANPVGPVYPRQPSIQHGSRGEICNVLCDCLEEVKYLARLFISGGLLYIFLVSSTFQGDKGIFLWVRAMQPTHDFKRKKEPKFPGKHLE